MKFVTNIQEYEEDAEVPRTRQLLQVIHQRLCKACNTITCTNQEGREMEVEKRARKSIQEVKGGIYDRTSFGSTRLRQRNESRGRCLRLYNGRSVVNKVWG